MSMSASVGGEHPQASEGIPPSPVSGVRPGEFPRTVRSQGVDRPPAIHEIETQREHLRLNLENWEKQWTDVLRYERAKVQDDANLATLRRALTRAGACLALSLSLLLPIITDGEALGASRFGSLTLREIALMASTVAMTVMLSSLWYAGHILLKRQRFRKSRTRPLLPPERLDAVQLLSSLIHEGDPLYYRERDVDPEEDASKLTFGWRRGLPPPPTPQS